MGPDAPPADAPAAAHRNETPGQLDQAVRDVADRAAKLAAMPASERADLLRRVTAGLAATAEQVVLRSCEAKGISPTSLTAAEEWLAGPYVSISLAEHLLLSTTRGRPSPALRFRSRPDGRAETFVPPMRPGGGLLETGLSFSVLHEAGLRPADIRSQTMAAFTNKPSPGVTAVLGAGNVSSIPVGDVLHAVLVEQQTAVLKMSPVNAYLTPLFEQALSPLIEQGYLRIVTGGADVGKALVEHASVTNVHLTGSNETHDRIVWGDAAKPAGKLGPFRGAPGQEDKQGPSAKPKARLDKRITSELGNVTPFLVMPYLYSARDLKFVVEMIATALVNNASFNCNAAKMIVLPKGFPQKELLLSLLSAVLTVLLPRKAYYPGAAERHERLTGPRENRRFEVKTFGTIAEGQLPWTIVTGLDPLDEREPLFSTEPFCSILSFVEVGSLDPAEYLDAAVRFCNDRLWGTLCASLIVPHFFEDDGAVELAVEKALVDLRYGTVGVNVWPAVGYTTARVPWGGHPSSTLEDVQSGIGFVHNSERIAAIDKTIIRGKLSVWPKPPYFATSRRAFAVAPKLTGYASAPTWGSALSVAKTTLFG